MATLDGYLPMSWVIGKPIFCDQYIFKYIKIYSKDYQFTNKLLLTFASNLFLTDVKNISSFSTCILFNLLIRVLDNFEILTRYFSAKIFHIFEKNCCLEFRFNNYFLYLIIFGRPCGFKICQIGQFGTIIVRIFPAINCKRRFNRLEVVPDWIEEIPLV